MSMSEILAAWRLPQVKIQVGTGADSLTNEEDGGAEGAGGGPLLLPLALPS